MARHEYNKDYGYSVDINPIEGYDAESYQEMMDWLDEHFTVLGWRYHEDWSHRNYLYYFDFWRQEDAMAFKLRWA